VIVPNNLNPNFSSNAVNWLANHYNNPSDPSKNLFKLDEENMIMAAVMAVSMQTVVTVTFHMSAMSQQKLVCCLVPARGLSVAPEYLPLTSTYFFFDASFVLLLFDQPEPGAGVRRRPAAHLAPRGRQYRVDVEPFPASPQRHRVAAPSAHDQGTLPRQQATRRLG
jgi:hypothetical protein